MRQSPCAAALAAALLLSGSAFADPEPDAHATAAQPPAAQPPAKSAPATPAKNQNPLICAQVDTTGSRLSKRECHTASEWAAIRGQGQDDLALDAQRHLSGHGDGAP